MAGQIGISRRWVALAAVGLLMALLVWAWWDGGEQPLRPLTARTMLPPVVQ